ncbi:MAG: RNA polymerase sigma factor [Isosphaeraceae bacterium]|nr:RNA polymerase sigma factor [Isosphaeraceae bacterium]
MLRSSLGPIAEPSVGSSLEHWPDADLLALFLQRRGPASEDAFAELVERYGPLVLRACRSIVGDEHEAQDAFQATFLVLARKGRGLWVRDSLAPWLHGVACRVASDARKSAARRRTFERRMAALGKPAAVIEERGDVDEVAAVLQEEICRLPELHRSAVVLCDLQGRTHQEAALLLHCPVGTIKSRQSRAREELRKRLARRGFAVSSLMLGLLLVEKRALASVAPGVVRATASMAVQFESGLPGRSSDLLGAPSANLLARAESASAAIASPRRVSPARLFLAASAVAAAALLAEPASQAWFGGRSKPSPLPRGSIAALRWGQSSRGPVTQPLARVAVRNAVARATP